MFRSHRTKYNSDASTNCGGAGVRRGLRDITNTATNAVKPVAKKSSMGASLRPLPSRSSFGLSSSSNSSALRNQSSLISARLHQSSRRVDEIDRNDVNNPQAVVEYVQDIHQHLRSVEGRKMVSPTYMSNQPHINEKMRAILIDWLVEVNLKFKLVPETLYLNVAILDMYLAKAEVVRNKLQLVGVTALLIAAKYEEIYPPEIRDLVYITDRAYTKSEILRMEAQMLQTLGFNVTVPTSHVFLCRFLKAAGADSNVTNMANFICERGLQEYQLLCYKPSIIAAASVSLARRTMRHSPWTSTLERHAQYSEHEIMPCVQDMANIMNSKSNLKAVSKKFSSPNFGSVSSMHVPV